MNLKVLQLLAKAQQQEEDTGFVEEQRSWVVRQTEEVFVFWLPRLIAIAIIAIILAALAMGIANPTYCGQVNVGAKAYTCAPILAD